jgi:hypothetical protein
MSSIITSGWYFQKFKLSSLESKLSIETRESWRESRLSKFSKFSIGNSAVTRIFRLGGQKTFFLSQVNLIVSKLITTLFFYNNDFLQANCTSH